MSQVFRDRHTGHNAIAAVRRSPPPTATPRGRRRRPGADCGAALSAAAGGDCPKPHRDGAACAVVTAPAMCTRLGLAPREPGRSQVRHFPAEWFMTGRSSVKRDGISVHRSVRAFGRENSVVTRPPKGIVARNVDQGGEKGVARRARCPGEPGDGVVGGRARGELTVAHG
jgi:hypothetical protein